MPGTYQYDVEIKSNVAKLLLDMKQVQDRLDTVEGKEYKIKLNVDEKKLSSVISNLEKMLNSLGKGTGDFKQFENLSKELSSVISEVQSLSKAFGKVDDSSAKTLLSSIQNIDKSLSDLSRHILNVNKNMSNMGGNTSDAVKQVENITNESKKAKSALDDVTKSQAKLNNSTEKQSIEFNTESFEKIKALFISIESSLSSIKGILVDVGDGEELSPLLKTVKEITTAVNSLNKSVSKIGFNINIESGEMDQKLLSSLNAKKQSLLSAYKTQFDAMRAFKPSGATIAMAKTENRSRVAALNKQINNFDGGASTDNIDQRITAFKEIIKLMKEVSQLSYGKDIYADMDSSFKNAVSSATGQVTRVQNELKKANIDGVGLENLFGSQDLSQVVEQLSRIADQFKNIAKAVSDFKTKFADGINVESSAKEIEKLTNRVKELESELAKIKTPTTVATPQESNISSGKKDAFPSTEATDSIEKTTQAIKEENNALEETANKAKQAVSELVKGRDVVSQNWYREKGTVISKDPKGNDITRDADEFSFVERLKNGQLQTVLATYDEETGKWAEQVINVKTAFEQVEKAIINADNKIASLEMSRDKTLAAHSGYDTTADDNQIAIERKKRDELQNTLNLYGQEKEYVFEIEAANKRIADNQERLNNKKQSQTNLRQTVSEEQFLKDWDAAIAENNKRNAESAKQQTKSIKEEWTNAVKAVKEYESAVTKLNNLKAQDKGLGTKKEEIEAQQKRIDELTSSFESARNTIISFFASTDKFNTLPTNSIKEVSDVLKLIGTAAQGSAESVAHLESETRKMAENTVDQYTNKISSYYEKSTDYKKSYDKFSSDGWASSEYSSKINQLNEEIEILDQKIAEVSKKKIVTKDDNDQLKQYKNNIESTIHDLKTMPATQKGYTNLSAQKMLSKINQLLKDNSNMSKKAKNDIRNWYNEIASGNPTASLDVILGKVQEIVNAEIDAGRGGKSMWDAIKEKAWYGAAGTIGTYFGVSDIIRYGKEGINTIRELDTAMTEVRKVSDATEAQYASFRDTVSSTAKEIASTNKELLNSSADFLRLGYSLEQAEDLARNATLFVNVGDGVDITEATEDMITAMKAFDIQAEDSIKIVDDYNQIGNKYALSATDIGEAMKRSASALEVGNNSFEESIGLITAMNEIVQNSENTGNSLKVLSLRLRGAKAELEDMGEDTDGLCDSTSKLREQVKALSGVDIMKDDNTFKSTAQQVKELGEAFVKLDDVSQAALLEIIAGKSRSNAVAALLKNYQQIDNVIADLGDAEGSALRENEAIVDSIDGRIKVLSATAEEFWQKFIDTDFIKNAVSLASDLLGLLTQIIDKFGTLPTIATGIGTALSFKNVGIDTLVAY